MSNFFNMSYSTSNFIWTTNNLNLQRHILFFNFNSFLEYTCLALEL